MLHYSVSFSCCLVPHVIVNSHWRDGAEQAKSVAVSNVSTSGNTVELVLSSPIENDQKVTVAYTDPSASNDGNAIQIPKATMLFLWERPMLPIIRQFLALLRYFRALKPPQMVESCCITASL